MYQLCISCQGISSAAQSPENLLENYWFETLDEQSLAGMAVPASLLDQPISEMLVYAGFLGHMCKCRKDFLLMRVFVVQVIAQRNELQKQVRDLQACASPDGEESALTEKVNTLSKRCQHLEVLSQRVQNSVHSFCVHPWTSQCGRANSPGPCSSIVRDRIK